MTSTGDEVAGDLSFAQYVHIFKNGDATDPLSYTLHFAHARSCAPRGVLQLHELKMMRAQALPDWEPAAVEPLGALLIDQPT